MEASDRQRIGSRIRQARQEAGLTQQELAGLLGITTRSIQNYESGAIVPYRHLGHIELIASKRAGWLLREDGNGDGQERTLSDLIDAMERHQTLFGAHLQLLLQNTERLREQREALGRRRRQRKAG